MSDEAIESEAKTDTATTEVAAPEHVEEAQPAAPREASRSFDARAFAAEHADPLIGLGLASTYVVWLLATARSLGFSRDEGFYFAASSDYKRWFVLLFSQPSRAFDRATIDAIWASNHEHPSLMKSLFALSSLFLHDKAKLFSDASTAFRFPAMLTMGLAIWLTYMFATRAYSRMAGVVAAVALGLMPRVFYHAHLACFDVPIMAMWTACVYVYWRAESGAAEGPGIALRGPGLARVSGLGAALAAGIVYGLTLETKHNAWMLPGVFLPHALLVHGRAVLRGSRAGRIPVPATLVAMATVGPAVFLLLWPWLWNDTLPRIQEYVNFHLHHDYYNIEFLGRTYFAPPSPKAYMPVMIAATVPTVTLLLFAVGAIDRVRAVLVRAKHALTGGEEAKRAAAPAGDRAYTDVLVLLALVVPLSVFLLPRTPVFGGTKHWITAYPFLAILAGRGFELAWRAVERLLASRSDLAAGRRRLAAQVALGVLAFAGPLAVTAHSHPFGLSSYVPMAGGTAGGADLGLNRQFWGFTTQSLAPYFAEHAPPGATVYIMDTAWPSWARMIDEKRLRPDLRGVGSPAEAMFSIVHHEQHINEVDYNIWTEYGTAAPDHVLTHDGVPIVSVYRRPGRGRP